MNDTVKRIVDLMFEDLQPSDEVQTLHDEVLSNCQARYLDCMNRGLTEDEAIGAVVESLKGMEEVLNDYPKVVNADTSANNRQEYTYRRESSNCKYDFMSSSLKRVRIGLTGEDVTLRPSGDAGFHVSFDEDANITIHDTDDTLVIERSHKTSNDSSPYGWHMEANDINVHAASFGKLVHKMFSKVRNETSGTSCDLTVYVPLGCQLVEAHTTSGNVDLRHTGIPAVKISTTSGDIDMELSEPCSRVEVSSASGDLELTVNAAQLQLSTMSGDLTYRGSAAQATLSTVSGDMWLDGSIVGSANTVSGDLRLNTNKARMDIHTTSGDVTVNPDSYNATVSIATKTVSGDIDPGHHASAGQQSDIVLSIATVSGDITVMG